jgi:hypothetical protein
MQRRITAVAVIRLVEPSTPLTLAAALARPNWLPQGSTLRRCSLLTMDSRSRRDAVAIPYAHNEEHCGTNQERR